MQIDITRARRAMATTAATLVLAGGISTAASPALAVEDTATDTVTCLAAEQYHAELAAAEAALVEAKAVRDEAKAAFKEAVKGKKESLGQQIAAFRAETREFIKAKRGVRLCGNAPRAPRCSSPS
jgi:hypothetical protein